MATAAIGFACPYGQTWVEFEPVSDGGWMMAVVLHTDHERLSPDEDAALSGETAEAWVRTCYSLAPTE